jgi:hypothetical protein
VARGRDVHADDDARKFSGASCSVARRGGGERGEDMRTDSGGYTRAEAVNFLSHED